MRFSIFLTLTVIVFSIHAQSPPTIDGYTYKTVMIGGREWFAENLKTQVYANGDEILSPKTHLDLTLTHPNGQKETSQIKTRPTLFDWVATDSGMFCTYGDVQEPYLENKEVTVRHILLSTVKGDAIELQLLERRADSLIRRLKAGDDFEDLVLKHTDDHGSKKSGGVYSFRRGRMVQVFEDFCFGHPAGSIGTIRTSYGVHVIEVLDAAVSEMGLLYNWFAVEDERGLCPLGWHVSTDDDWGELELFAGMEEVDIERTSHLGSRDSRGVSPGLSLKAKTGWEEPWNAHSTDEFGFSGLPCGMREGDSGNYIYAGFQGRWWCSGSYCGGVIGRWLADVGTEIYRGFTDPNSGYSVRCVRDSD